MIHTKPQEQIDLLIRADDERRDFRRQVADALTRACADEQNTVADLYDLYYTAVSTLLTFDITQHDFDATVNRLNAVMRQALEKHGEQFTPPDF